MPDEELPALAQALELAANADEEPGDDDVAMAIANVRQNLVQLPFLLSEKKVRAVRREVESTRRSLERAALPAVTAAYDNWARVLLAPHVNVAIPGKPEPFASPEEAIAAMPAALRASGRLSVLFLQGLGYLQHDNRVEALTVLDVVLKDLRKAIHAVPMPAEDRAAAELWMARVRLLARMP